MNQREKEQLKILNAYPEIATPLLLFIKAFQSGEKGKAETIFKSMTPEEQNASVRFLECGLQA